MPSTIVNPIPQIRNTILADQTVLKNHNRFDSDVSFKTLIGWHGGTNTNCTLRELGVTSGGYVVPSGKKFIALVARVRTNFASSGLGVHLQGGGTDVGFNSASAATTLDSDSSTGGHAIYFSTASGVYSGTHSILLVVSVGRYVQARTSSSEAEYVVWGYEVDTDVTSLNP